MGEERPAWFSSRLEAITQLSSDSIFVLDRDHRITYINRTAEGLEVEDAIGTPIFDLLTADQAKVAREAFAKASKTGEKTSYEITFPLPDGRLSRWATHIGPEKDGGFVVVSSDVTEHASAREEIDLLFALSRDLLFIFDFEGRYHRVNPAAIATLGYSFEELSSMPLLDLIHPEDRARSEASFRQVVEEGAEFSMFENRCVTKDGRTRVLQWSSRPDFASRRFVAIARDITESRATEQQLRQSQKMDAIGQLAGGIAHDFNNLIQTIFGAVDLVNRKAPDSRTAEQVKDIEMAAERAAELVRRLLSFSRQQPLTTELVDVGSLIDDSVRLLRHVLPATIEVRVEAREGAHLVLADRAELEQALMNLCLNSRDAMPTGGALEIDVGKIDVGAEMKAPLFGVRPGRYVVLSVVDHGIGMTPEVRERMFDPFFTTKPVGRGTGLGMSMVYGAIHRHGGVVLVESAPGEGTRVSLVLPEARGEQSARVTNRAASIRAEPSHETILVAEDDPYVRRLCVEILESSGFRVLAAANGLEAIALAQSNDDISLALFDVVMPEATGPEAYASIRAFRDVPVIFFSGYSDGANFTHTIPEGAPLLAKPVRASELLVAVRNQLKLRA